jgi:hypothetical protein
VYVDVVDAAKAAIFQYIGEVNVYRSGNAKGLHSEVRGMRKSKFAYSILFLKIHSRRWLKRNNYVIKDSIVPALDYALNGLAALILM